MNSTTQVDTDPAGRWHALVALAASSVLSTGAWFSATAVLPQLRAVWHLSAGVCAWITMARIRKKEGAA